MSHAVESRSHQLAPLAAAVTTFVVDAAVLPDLQKLEEVFGIRRRNKANGHHTCQLINYSMLQKHFINKFDSGTSLLSMTKMLRIKIISRNAAVAKKQMLENKNNVFKNEAIAGRIGPEHIDVIQSKRPDTG